MNACRAHKSCFFFFSFFFLKKRGGLKKKGNVEIEEFYFEYAIF